jgi:hypothetical protein
MMNPYKSFIDFVLDSFLWLACGACVISWMQVLNRITSGFLLSHSFTLVISLIILYLFLSSEGIARNLLTIRLMFALMGIILGVVRWI